MPQQTRNDRGCSQRGNHEPEARVESFHHAQCRPKSLRNFCKSAGGPFISGGDRAVRASRHRYSAAKSELHADNFEPSLAMWATLRLLNNHAHSQLQTPIIVVLCLWFPRQYNLRQSPAAALRASVAVSAARDARARRVRSCYNLTWNRTPEFDGDASTGRAVAIVPAPPVLNV